MASLNDLIVRVGVEGIPAFKNAFKDAIEALETTGDRAAKAGSSISRAFSNLGIQDSSAKVAAEAKRLQGSFELLERAFKDGKISAADFAKANEGLKTSLERLAAPTQTIAEKMEKLGKSGEGLKNIGSALTAAISLPIAGAAIAVTKFAADFELAMRQVTSLLGKDAAASFKPLSDGVLELSKRLGVDAVGAARALYEAISAGVPKENVLAFIEVASKAAIAGVTQTKVAVDGMTTIMNSYRLEAGKAAEVSDAMFQAVNLGKFTFEQLAASMSVAAPIAAQVGVGFKDLLAAAATLTSKGVPVSEAMTQIAAAMRSIIAPSKEMEALFAKIGVSSGEALIKSKGLQGALEAVRDAAGGSSDVLSKATGRIEGFNAILSLTGDNSKKAREDLKSLNDSIGATDAAFAEIEKSFSRQLDAFTAQAKALGIELGTALLPFAKSALEAIKPLISVIGELAQGFKELPSPVQLAVGGFVALAAVAGPLLLIVGQMATSVSGLATAFQALGGIGSISSAFQSIGIAASGAAVGVAALVGAAAVASILLTIDAIEKLRQRYKDLAEDQERRRTGKNYLIAGSENDNRPLNSLAAEANKAAAALQEPKQGSKIDLKAIATELDIFGTAAKNTVKPVEDVVVAHGKLGKAVRESAADHKLARNAIKEFADGIPVAIVREYEAKVQALQKAIARATIEIALAKQAGRDWDSQLESNIAAAQALSAELLKSANSALPAYVAGLGKIKGATSGLTDDLKEAVKIGKAQFGDIKDAFKAFGFSEQELTSADEMAKLWGLLAENVGKVKEGRLITQNMADIAASMSLKKTIEEQRALGNATDEYEAKLAKVQLRLSAIRSDNDAYKVAGLDTLEALEAQATLTAQAYEVIATTGRDSSVRVLTAQQKALEAQRELAIATGQAWDGIDDQLSRVADRLARATSLKGVSDLQAAFLNFANAAGAAITKSFGDAFDALIKGDFKGVGKAFSSMWKGVAESAVKTFTDPLKNALGEFFGKTVRDLLKGSLSGVKEDIKDIASVIKGMFGAAPQSAQGLSGILSRTPTATPPFVPSASGGGASIPSSAGGAGGGAASASSLLGSISNVANIVTALATVAAGIGAAFQASETNKTLDAIGKHTLQTANDLANLRADSWTREGHLMTKLDDILITCRDGFKELRDAIKGSLSLNLSVGANTEKAKQLTDAVISRLGNTDATVGDRLKETNTSLRHIEAAIPEWTLKVIKSIETGTASLLGKLQEIERNGQPSILKTIFSGFSGGGVGGIFSGVGSAVSALPNAIFGGIASAIKGLFGGGGKDTGATEVNTRAAVAELANLRADAWTRHSALMNKLDDIWRTALDVLDAIGGPLIAAVESIGTAFAGVTDSLASAIDRLTGLNDKTGEANVVDLTGLAEIISTSISDLGNQIAIAFAEAAQSIVDAVQAGFGVAATATSAGAAAVVAGTAAAASTQTIVLSSVQSMVDFLAKLTQDQTVAFEALPPEIKSAINAGKLADLVNGQDQATKDALAGYLKITNELKQVRDAINALKPAAEATAAASTSSAFALDQVRANIVPTNGGFDTSSVLAGLAAFSDRMAGYWERLFEVIAGGVTQSTATASATASAFNSPEEAQAFLNSRNGSSISQAELDRLKNTPGVTFGDASSAVSAPASGSGVASQFDYGDFVFNERQKLQEQITADFKKTATAPLISSFNYSDFVFNERLKLQDQITADFRKTATPAGFTATPYIPPDYSSSYVNTVPRSSVGASPELTASLLPAAPSLYPVNSAEWKAAQMDWQNTRAPQVSNWTPTPAAPSGGGGYPMPPQIPIQVAIDGKVIAERMAVYYEQLGYR
jgi:TP901 family phage tail tape measure protein